MYHKFDPGLAGNSNRSMGTAVAVSLLLVAFTFAYFIMVNLEKFAAGHRRIDALGALWSLAMALWFGYAAIWVLLHAN